MKRKLIALAVAGAFAPAIAMADTSVTIYGTMNGAWNYVKADGQTAGLPGTATAAAPLGFTTGGLAAGYEIAGKQRLDVDSSNIGFRVKEDLGGGLNAWGQCEISMNFDSGGGAVCSRNAGVGLEGAFGNVFFGQWDTPHKQFGSIDVMGNTHIVSWGAAIMHSPGVNTAATTAGNGVGVGAAVNNSATLVFDRRQQNTINYYTPNWSGFQIKAQYSADEEKQDDRVNLATGAVTPGLDPWLVSVSAAYDNGPLFIGASYEKHTDYNNNPLGFAGLTTSNDDYSYQVAASYKFGNFKLSAAWDKLHYERDSNAFLSGEVERDAFYVGASYTTGPHYFALSYAAADDWDCSGSGFLTVNPARCNDTGADMYAAKYEYSLSKRTSVFVHYVQIDNDSQAQYNFGTNPLTDANVSGAVAPGADPEGFGVGVKHKF